MPEEKKATVNVTVAADFKFKVNDVDEHVKIVFNMTDVPVDATDSNIADSVLGIISEQLTKPETKILKGLCFDKPHLIVVSKIGSVELEHIEIKRGE